MRPMIERVTDYPGYLIRFRPERPSRRAILLLHGFPGYRNVKNLDLADCLHRHFQRDVFLLHYQGLGENRDASFGFTSALHEVFAVVDRLVDKEGFEPLTVIGHSWGGLVTVNTAAERSAKVRTAILLSPLCNLDPKQGLYDWIVRGVRDEVPGIYGQRTDAEVLADIEQVRREFSPMEQVAKFAPDLRFGIIQAAQDETTPASATKALVARCARRPVYQELDLDHSFSQNRRQLAETVIRLLEKLEAQSLDGAVDAVTK